MSYLVNREIEKVALSPRLLQRAAKRAAFKGQRVADAANKNPYSKNWYMQMFGDRSQLGKLEKQHRHFLSSAKAKIKTIKV